MSTRDEANRLSRAFLLLLTLGMSLLFLSMIRAFVLALVLAAIFAALAYPFYRRILALLGGHRAAAAAIVLMVILMAVIGPLTALVTVLVSQAIEVRNLVSPWVEKQLDNPTALQRFIDSVPILGELAPYRDDLLAKAGELVGRTAGFVTNALAAGTRGTAKFLLSLFVMLYAMFFFFLDGRTVMQRILYYIPLSSDDERLMLDKFTSVTRATLKGTVVIGIIQGLLGGVAFAAAGIPGSVFWGTIMAVLSIIPGVGIALVWVPAAIYLAISDRLVATLLFSIWCGLVAGTADNVLRPRLVGRDAKMSDLMILVSTLGGLAMFGAAGILIGPVIAALFVTVWELYGEAFSDLLPRPPGFAGPGPAGPGPAGPGLGSGSGGPTTQPSP